MIQYPYVYDNGVKKLFADRTWVSIYNAYFNDDNNEGYWIKKEAGL